ncbi:hypothetical protein RB195_022479 [Necator americanus]|uniref:G-protein coupled receptors family 1 profile domain-containing protein n=1 Tax=Necator americanus TaxID=51031 RepID=A0ABR1EFM3_NECAM
MVALRLSRPAHPRESAECGSLDPSMARSLLYLIILLLAVIWAMPQPVLLLAGIPAQFLSEAYRDYAAKLLLVKVVAPVYLPLATGDKTVFLTVSMTNLSISRASSRVSSACVATSGEVDLTHTHSIYARFGGDFSD